MSSCAYRIGLAPLRMASWCSCQLISPNTTIDPISCRVCFYLRDPMGTHIYRSLSRRLAFIIIPPASLGLQFLYSGNEGVRKLAVSESCIWKNELSKSQSLRLINLPATSSGHWLRSSPHGGDHSRSLASPRPFTKFWQWERVEINDPT